MKVFKRIMVAMMAMAIIVLSGVCYNQHNTIVKLETGHQVLSNWWHETMAERNELRLENEELNDNLKIQIDKKNDYYQQLVVHH